MAQQVRLVSSTILFIALSIAGCNPPDIFIESGATATKLVNGIMFSNNQPFTGSLYSFYPGTRDTMEISGWLEGKENGSWKKFFPNKMLKENREFANGAKVGVYTAWWENGKKQLEYQFGNDEYEGICREWNRSGILIKEMNYVKGHEVGSQKMFYDNGKVRSNYVVLNGRRFGLLGSKNCTNVSDSIFKN